jgi:hypothetical protein
LTWSSAPTACIRARDLVLSPEWKFAHFLGLYVTALHVARGELPIDREVKL